MTTDGRCKYCDAPVRWVELEIGRAETARVPLDLAPVETGGLYAVAGKNTAMRVPKEARSKYSKLYRKHECDQAKEAKRIRERERRDAAQRFGWKGASR